MTSAHYERRRDWHQPDFATPASHEMMDQRHEEQMATHAARSIYRALLINDAIFA